MQHLTRAAALSAILLLPLLTTAAVDRRARAAAQPAQSYTYRGTVHAIDARTSSVALITGVGMALRLVQLRALSTTHISAAGAPIPLTALKPGDVVRADCHRTAAGLVADQIERLDGGAR